MEAHLSYRLELDILFMQITGNSSAEDILGLYERAFTDRSTPPKVSIIIDTRLSEAAHHGEDMNRVQGLGKYSGRIIREAVVVSSDRHMGDTRQAPAYAEMRGREIQAFRDMDQAMEWIEPALVGVCGLWPLPGQERGGGET